MVFPGAVIRRDAHPCKQAACLPPTKNCSKCGETMRLIFSVLRQAVQPLPPLITRILRDCRSGGRVVGISQNRAPHPDPRASSRQKGFGFISPEGGGKDVFVHASAVEAAGMRSLAEGQRVSFDVQPDAKGAKAVNLKSA
jgi:cold shock protein